MHHIEIYARWTSIIIIYFYAPLDFFNYILFTLAHFVYWKCLKLSLIVWHEEHKSKTKASTKLSITRYLHDLKQCLDYIRLCLYIDINKEW